MNFIIEVLEGLSETGAEEIKALEFIGLDENCEVICEGPFVTSQVGLRHAIFLAQFLSLMDRARSDEVIRDYLTLLPEKTNLNYIPRTSKAHFFLLDEPRPNKFFFGFELRN